MGKTCGNFTKCEHGAEVPLQVLCYRISQYPQVLEEDQQTDRNVRIGLKAT